MSFFSVYDIIKYKAEQKGDTDQEIFEFFRISKVKKREIETLRNSSLIPTEDRLITPILNYLEMSFLELELMLGRIPTGYEDTFRNNIREIAKLLTEEKDSREKFQSHSPEIKPYFSTDYGKLYNGDCIKLFKLVPDNSVDCVFADPPFNLDKEYDKGVNDKKTYSEYISWCIEWLNECIRVLKPGGSLFIYNIPKWHTYLASHLNTKLNFWNWIAVDMKFSLPIQNKLYPAHYSLLYYVKGEKPNTFNPQRIPIQTCRHCGGEIKDYGGYKNKMNPKGVNVSDVWTDIYPVRHSSFKNRKFNELPVKLLDRVITMSTNKGDVILDPFGGSGTTFGVAELLERKWIGFELGNADVIKERLLEKKNDIYLMNKIYSEKNTLFPDSVRKLRENNNFWLPEDFNAPENSFSDKNHEKSGQQTLF